MSCLVVRSSLTPRSSMTITPYAKPFLTAPTGLPVGAVRINEQVCESAYFQMIFIAIRL